MVRSVGAIARSALAASAWLLAVAAHAAPPTVPALLPYQALFLDGMGQARTGSIDLTLRIYDAGFGGTLLYKQSFPSVVLSDGVASVQLGPVGAASDSPSNPLTTDLATALAGDPGASAPVRYLEATVGAEAPLSRTQVLASAYALRASSAATADTAATAADTGAVGGFPSEWVNDFLTYSDLDGGLPSNTDPLEGTADVDGDELPNFLDEDNDGDGLFDRTEVTNGTHVNLVTPRITGNPTPSQGFFALGTPINVGGHNFSTGMTITLGSQSQTATVLNPNTATIVAGPQLPGQVDLTVTLPNGEAATRFDTFTFSPSTSHPVSVAAPNVSIAARPGLEVLLGGTGQYGVGTLAQTVFPLANKGGSFARIGVAFDAAGRVAGIRCRDLGTSCAVELLIDGDDDDALEDETGIPIETVPSSNGALLMAALEPDAAGHWAAGYIRVGPLVTAATAHDRNGDGDFADANEVVAIETGLASFALPSGGALAVDSASRLAFAYPRGVSVDLRFAWDRNGDGDFTDTIGGNPELATLESLLPNCLGAAFDASDRLAVIYASAAGTKLARDGNADGDFADPGEIQILTATAANGCDVANRSGQALAAAYSTSSVNTVLLMDGNEDGDFADAGETTTLTVGANPLGLALDGASHAVIGTAGFLRFGITN